MVLPMEDDDFRLLMQRVAEGSEEAARELVDRYGGSLRRAIRRTMDSRLRRMFDSVDFAQNAWASFFRERSRVERFKNPQDLVQFLVAVGRNKVINEARRRLGMAKSNLDRESVLAPHELEQSIDKSRRFSPVDAAVAGDELQRLLRDLPPEEQEMVRLRSRGLTQKEVGAATQKPRTTVQRFFARLFRKKRHS
jgi:RNA polymerase sigma factor (sigma-70 family)